MKKILLILAVLLIGALSLISCGSKDDAPEGLQTADVREDAGYVFYAPENWSVINAESISAAKVSAINNTSITFTEAPVPATTLPEYFDESMASMPKAIADTLTVTVRDSKCNFGNADGECLKYVYTYKYEGYDFACMQILVNNGGKFYIFTYNSYGDVNSESSDYQSYLSAVQLAIDNFTFTEAKGDSGVQSYQKDADGYNMVSNKEISGFELYLPDTYTVLYSDAYVKAKITDGANISISKATSTGVSIADYWNLRKTKLSNFVSNIEEIAVNQVNDAASAENKVIFGDLDRAKVAAYEYKYTFNGNTYHVYQVMGVDVLSGYVFTYTALEDEYNTHIDEIKTILEKVRF